MRSLATARCLNEMSGAACAAPAPVPAAAAAAAVGLPPAARTGARCAFGYIMTVPLGAELAKSRCEADTVPLP